MNAKRKGIVKEYYESTVCMLSYRWDRDHEALAKEIFRFLLQINGEENALDECFSIVSEACCVQTDADVQMLNTAGFGSSADSSFAVGIKSDLLIQNEIKRLKPFDVDLLAAATETLAERGAIHACKLWAILNWLESIEGAEQETALRLWEMLAVNGDRTAMLALSHCYGEMGEGEKARIWEETRMLCRKAGCAALPFFAPQNENACDEAMRYAEMIACIKSREPERESRFIDRYLSYYALYGRDDSKTKLERLSSERNFYLVMLDESRARSRNTIGFTGGS